MADPPLVSVIVPAYKAEATIAAALDSIRAQGRDDLEVIVVNDGSPDGTGRVVQAGYPEVVYIEQENAGASTARNAAIAVARGKFLAFLDADDCWAPGFLAHLLELFERYPEASAVSCNAMVRRGRRAYPFCLVDGTQVRELSLLDLLRGIRPPGPAVLARASACRDIDGFDPDIFHVADIDFLCRLASGGHRLFYSTRCLYLKVERAGNLSSHSYSIRGRGVIKGLHKLDPRCSASDARRALTAYQYSSSMAATVVRASYACWCEGKVGEGTSFLKEVDALPVRPPMLRLARALGRRCWPLFGYVVGPWILWLRLSRAVYIWGLIGFLGQLWQRRVQRVSSEI